MTDMERLTRDAWLMQMAEVTAKRGTCSRLQVGALILRDNRIISMGYNGAPSGMPHCVHREVTCRCMNPGTHLHLHEGKGCTAAVHAEANAIVFAARFGHAVAGAAMVVTHQPCLKCAELIINAGIGSVLWRHPYRLTEGLELLNAAGVKVRQYEG